MSVETVRGALTRIIFYSESIFIVKIECATEETTVLLDSDIITGPTLHLGELLTIKGNWKHSMTFGDQLVARSCDRELVISDLFLYWLSKASQMRGVGRNTCKKLISCYSYNLESILSVADVMSISRNTGISHGKILTICEEWRTYKSYIETVKFLVDYNFPHSLSMKCISAWGGDAKKLLTENPYVLCCFMSFTETDRFISDNRLYTGSQERLVAGAVDVLTQYFFKTGNTVMPFPEFSSSLERLTQLDAQFLNDAQKSVLRLNQRYVQSAGLYCIERLLEQYVSELNFREKSGCMFSKDIQNRFENSLSFRLNHKQKMAVEYCLSNPLVTITGGAGTGKSTIIAAVVSQFLAQKYEVVLLAPTGKAAQRLKEITKRDVKTIAKFVNDSAKEGRRVMQTNLAVIVDECSMIDIMTAYNLFRNLPKSVNLIFVGDERQLAPVGGGLFYHLLVRSSLIPSVKLEQTTRQTEETAIPLVSREILLYKPQKLARLEKIERRGVFIRDDDVTEDEQVDRVAKLCVAHAERIPNIEIADVTVIAAKRTSVFKLNNAIQKLVNPNANKFNDQLHLRTNERFFVGDRVICNKNDYNKGVTNGTTGTIAAIYPQTKEMIIDGKIERVVMSVMFDDANCIEPAHIIEQEFLEGLISLSYAITCHKSQGSQYDCVIVLLDCRKLIDNSWVYTALTRAINVCYFFGQETLLNHAITRKSKAEERLTGLSFAHEA